MSMVDQICSILVGVSETVAKQALQQTNGDVERAINHLLEEHDKNKAKHPSSQSRPRNHTTTTRSNISAKTRPRPWTPLLFPNHRPHQDNCQPIDTRDTIEALTSSTSSSADDDSKLSEQWHASCVRQRHNANGSTSPRRFVDDAFPPRAQALDGRQRTLSAEKDGPLKPDSSIVVQSSGSSIATTSCHGMIRRCACGLIATPRVVQSDGPNYGRFYLSCGQTPPSSRSTTGTTTSTKTNNNKCNFFQWDPHGTIGAAIAAAAAATSENGYRIPMSGLDWAYFDASSGCIMVQASPDGGHLFQPSHVRQGQVGNCWFISALAVVAERPDLIQRIVPRTTLNEFGCNQINLCLDGQWTPIIVDSYLPVVVKDRSIDERSATAATQKRRRTANNPSRRSDNDGVTLPHEPTRMAFPAFAATPSQQLWPALVEKAYAKAHGSYSNLSGGWISEALHDLTGAPTETIPLSKISTSTQQAQLDELWVRMVSFSEAGFVMGVATSHGGDGLVGQHAYSILDVVELHNYKVGAQCKVTDFFEPCRPKSQTQGSDDPIERLTSQPGSPINTHASISTAHPPTRGERTTIRLVRIRNPWGRRVWKGAWSADSETWTKALRHRLKSSWSKDDGTFFMSFEDMVQRFHHLDVAKAGKDWVFTSTEGLFLPSREDLLTSSKYVYHVRPQKRTWAFLSVIQPKKRSNTTSRYFYCDPSFLLLKKKVGNGHDWECEASDFCGVQRISTCEVFLDPDYSYLCIPFSGLSTLGETFSFRFTCYSASKVELQQEPDASTFASEPVLTLLHTVLLKQVPKLLYPVGERCLLSCIHGDGCLYFLGINGSRDSFLSLKLVIEGGDGFHALLGRWDDTHDIPPCSQRLLVIVSRSGSSASSTQLKFRYLSDKVTTRTVSTSGDRQVKQVPQNASTSSSAVAITPLADLLCREIDADQVRDRGNDVIDTNFWIPQIGAA